MNWTPMMEGLSLTFSRSFPKRSLVSGEEGFFHCFNHVVRVVKVKISKYENPQSQPRYHQMLVLDIRLRLRSEFT